MLNNVIKIFNKKFIAICIKIRTFRSEVSMPTKGCKPQPVDKRYSTTTNVFIAKLLEDKTAEHKWWIWGQQKRPSCCRKEQTSPRLKIFNIQT